MSREVIYFICQVENYETIVKRLEKNYYVIQTFNCITNQQKQHNIFYEVYYIYCLNITTPVTTALVIRPGIQLSHQFYWISITGQSTATSKICNSHIYCIQWWDIQSITVYSSNISYEIYGPQNCLIVRQYFPLLYQLLTQAWTQWTPFADDICNKITFYYTSIQISSKEPIVSMSFTCSCNGLAPIR